MPYILLNVWEHLSKVCVVLYVVICANIVKSEIPYFAVNNLNNSINIINNVLIMSNHVYVCVSGYRAPLESPLRAAEVAAVKSMVRQTWTEEARASTASTRANHSSMLAAMTEVTCKHLFFQCNVILKWMN